MFKFNKIKKVKKMGGKMSETNINDVKILEEILKQNGADFSVEDFAVYTDPESVPGYEEYEDWWLSNWYLIQNNRIIKLGIRNLKSINGFEKLENLEGLDLRDCGLTNVKLSNLPKLKELDLSWNSKLKTVNLRGLDNLGLLILKGLRSSVKVSGYNGEIEYR